MGYSKISSVELTNFMSFKKAKILFDETGIINIKGYNDSGKSAILRGIVVCLMDMFKRNQLKFIRHGEEYFRVVISFDDGITIVRDKYINGQSLYELYKDQDLLFTTKQGNRLSKIDGVPKPIADYLGLCVTDSVYLNYQSCIDKLPVVDTTGSENYQMFHEVLRMEEIFRANNMINADKNDLGLEISTMEYELEREKVLLDRCGDVSKEFIDEIVKLDEESNETNNKKNSLKGIQDIFNRYNSIVDIPVIKKISVNRLKELNNLGVLVDTLDRKKEIPHIEKVSLDRVSYLYNIGNTISRLEKYKKIPDIPKVDLSLVDKKEKLSSIVKVYKLFENHLNNCSNIENNIVKLKSQLDELVNKAKEKGIELVKCENCGCYTGVGGHTHE